MAGLEVADVLDDPDFQDVAQYIRRTAVRGATGRTEIVENSPVGIEVVSVPGVMPETAKRLPEGTRTDYLRTFFTRTALTIGDAANNLEADIIVWNGDRWKLVYRDPWTNFGSGYVEAVGTLERQR